MTRVNDPQLFLEWNSLFAHWDSMCQHFIDFHMYVQAFVASLWYSNFGFCIKTSLISSNVSAASTYVYNFGEICKELRNLLVNL